MPAFMNALLMYGESNLICMRAIFYMLKLSDVMELLHYALMHVSQLTSVNCRS